MTETATLAAGCFWGVEEAFRRLPGVTATRVGYTGGRRENPGYYDVCSGNTGHAEAVEVIFDADRVTYAEILRAFWDLHDPTTPNRQGPDVGSQYRSAIFTHSEAQAEAARASRHCEDQSGRHAGPIVTEIQPAGTFWPAEDYHQQYYAKKGISGCRL